MKSSTISGSEAIILSLLDYDGQGHRLTGPILIFSDYILTYFTVSVSYNYYG